MSSQAIHAGDAFVELSLRNMLGKGLAKADADLWNFGASVQNVGQAIADMAQPLFDFFAGSVAEFTKTGSEVNDLSDALGVGTDAIQTLGYAAGQTGAEATDLAMGLKRSQKLLSAAKGGSKEATKQLDKLGLSLESLIGLKPEDQFRAMGLAIGSIADPADRTAAAMDVFGKSGAKLIPMFADAKGLALMENRLRDLGAVMTPSQVKWADAFGDALDDLNKAFTGFKNAVAGALVPALTGLTHLFTDIVPQVSKWVSENESLTISLAIGTTGVLGFGLALAMTGAGIVALGAFIASVTVITGSLAAVVAALASPLGIALVAVVALGAGVVALGVHFTNITGVASQSIKGIADALAGGDLVLAGKVALAGLATAAFDIAARVKSIFADMVNAILGAFDEVASAMLRLKGLAIGGDSAGLDATAKAVRGESRAKAAADARKSDEGWTWLAQFVLDDATGEAARKKQAVLDGFKNRPQGGDDDLSATESNLSSRGTFNPALIRGLQGGDPIQKQQLEVQKNIEKGIGKLEEAFLAGQPEFGA